MTVSDKFRKDQGRAPTGAELAHLEAQLENIHVEFAKNLGFRVPEHVALEKLNTAQPNMRYNGAGRDWSNFLPARDVAKWARESVDWVSALYRGILGRDPDADGRAFYAKLHDIDGWPVSAIAEDIEKNKAEGAR